MLLSNAAYILAMSSLIKVVYSDIITLYEDDQCGGKMVARYSAVDREVYTPFEASNAESLRLMPDNDTVYYLTQDKAAPKDGNAVAKRGCQSISGVIGIYAKDSPTQTYSRSPSPRRRSTRTVVHARNLGGTRIVTEPVVGGEIDTPYFLQVTEQSSAAEETTGDDDDYLQLALVAAANRNRNRGTDFEVEELTDNFDHVNLRLRLTDGTVDQFAGSDLRNVIQNFLAFRFVNGDAAEFAVNIWTGRPGGQGGIIGNLQFRFV
ncbi:hypothetical protein LTS10_003480 [Elasticomyces elasticus]|nr:hypothetical protein LTS10_003480 [Elasticomyces elasticus]